MSPITLLAPVRADGISEVARQDRAEPGTQLLVGLTTKLLDSLMGLQERLLNDVRRIELQPQPRIELQPRQEAKVFAVVLEWSGGVPGTLSHGAPYLQRRFSREKLTRIIPILQSRSEKLDIAADWVDLGFVARTTPIAKGGAGAHGEGFL